MTIAVKICGLSDENAIKAIIRAGADYAGFVHFPASPRHITFERAAELKVLLPSSIHSVSVMVDPDDALLEQSCAVLTPDYVQLHGNETPQRIKDIRKKFPAMKIIKAISVRSADDVAQAERFYDGADILLFDAKAPEAQSVVPPSSGATRHLLPEGEGSPGGNGLVFDWRLLKNRTFPLPWFLSGGLNAANVAEAIRISGAKMVDVSSGVESSRGVKDVRLIEEFVKATRV